MNGFLVYLLGFNKERIEGSCFVRLVQSSVVLIDFSFAERGETEPCSTRVFTVDSLEHTRSEKNVRGLLLFQVQTMGKIPMYFLRLQLPGVYYKMRICPVLSPSVIKPSFKESNRLFSMIFKCR